MANTTKSSIAKKTTAPTLKGVPNNVKTHLTKMSDEGLKVSVIGQVKNGKLELDQSSLEELSRKFPDAKFAFVAVNAPFDPVQNQQ